MRILVIRGRDIHTSRLIQGFSACGVQIKVINNYNGLDGSEYDLTLVDPSINFDPTPKINSDRIMFYDCEDGPQDFYPDIGYKALKDKCEAYVKMNWIDNDRKDGIKNIGFPLKPYLNLSKIANMPTYEFNQSNEMPILVAAPTFIGSYTPIKNVNYSEDKKRGIKSIGIYDDGIPMYNQRIDWLLSLYKKSISYIGGIVFSGANLSKEWQTKYFGNVHHLEHQRLSYDELIQKYIKYKIALCPTGHERLSWRVFDIMAIGAILIWTDRKGQNSMLMPKEYITIKDGEDLGIQLLTSQKYYREIWKAHQKNREVFKDLTPEKIIDLFWKQLK